MCFAVVGNRSAVRVPGGGLLSFTHLFAARNEFQQFFPPALPRLSIITRWNLRYEMLVALLACLVSFNIYQDQWSRSQATKNTLVARWNQSPHLLACQYETWLLGMQIVYFAPIACLTTSWRRLLGLSLKAKLTIRRFVIVSTFSSANGILCWVLYSVLVVCDWRRPLSPF
jgi:hypothetical protein